jgi:hypothetical protein
MSQSKNVFDPAQADSPFCRGGSLARIVVQRRRAAAAVENIPLQTNHHSGTRPKSDRFRAGTVISFSPEC